MTGIRKNDSDFTTDAVRAMFCHESMQMLEQGERALYDMMRYPDCMHFIDTVHRAAHSIKGNAMMVGYEDIAQYAQLFVELLRLIKKGEVELAFELVLVSLIKAQLTLDLDVSFLEKRNDRCMVVQHLKLPIHSGNRD